MAKKEKIPEVCEACDDNLYLEVTTEEGEENQWCQNCFIEVPIGDPPKLNQSKRKGK